MDESTARMRRFLQEKTGKSFAAWIGIARSLGSATHGDVVAYLKEAGPMGHGYANAIAHEARKPEAVAEEDPFDVLFAGDKRELRPVYQAIAKYVKTIGRDVELLPKKTHVSVRRATQFALVQPSTATRIDLGIKLKDVAPEGKLEASGSWNGMVSHRVRIEKPEDFDLQVRAWLKLAYDHAG